MNILRAVVVIFLFFLLGDICSATPLILSTSGIIDDGKTIVISGRDFGSNSLRYSWTGNKIESGTPGTSFSMASWTNHTDAPPDRFSKVN